MTKFSNKILKKPIFAPFSTFLGQFFFKSSSVTHNTTWASNTIKKIVFSEKTNEAIPKKLPDGQVQTHRTLPFQKKPGVQKGIKIWTYTHARPQTYKHAWTHRERERATSWNIRIDQILLGQIYLVSEWSTDHFCCLHCHIISMT